MGLVYNYDLFVGYRLEGVNLGDKCPPSALLREIEGAPSMKTIRELLPRLPCDVASTYTDVGALMTATSYRLPTKVK